MNSTITYNKERKHFADKFLGYENSILKDDDYSKVIIHSISQDVQMFKRKFKRLHTFKDSWNIFRTKQNLKAKVVNFDKLCHQLDYIIARLDIRED